MAADLELEACPSVAQVGIGEALEGGAVLQEARCSSGGARVSRGGVLHARVIVLPARARNPWRE